MTERTDTDLHFAITPTRVRFHETVYTDKEKVPKSGIAFNASMATIKNGGIQLDRMSSPFMHGSAYRAGYFHYFDSHYCNDFVMENPVYVGRHDVVTFKLNLQTGLLSDTTYLLDKEGWMSPRPIAMVIGRENSKRHDLQDTDDRRLFSLNAKCKIKLPYFRKIAR